MSGNVLMPVESAIRTRRFVRSARKTGRTRRGFDAMFNSSRLVQRAKTGGNAPKKLADMSRARSEEQIGGMLLVKNEGMAFGVLEEPMRR